MKWTRGLIRMHRTFKCVTYKKHNYVLGQHSNAIDNGTIKRLRAVQIKIKAYCNVNGSRQAGSILSPVIGISDKWSKVSKNNMHKTSICSIKMEGRHKHHLVMCFTVSDTHFIDDLMKISFCCLPYSDYIIATKFIHITTVMPCIILSIVIGRAIYGSWGVISQESLPTNISVICTHQYCNQPGVIWYSRCL